MSDFIEWRGGKNPVPGQRVRVIYRGSNVPAARVYESERLDWGAHPTGSQIVAYRVEA